ncbi:MAG: VanZ family protein [Burkholderiales bacterium]
MRFLLAVYVLLIGYASLYPLTGWREPHGSPFAFLASPWPRYITAFDLAANFLGYLPFGLLCALALDPRRSTPRVIAMVALLGAALSLSLESVQSYLPARIASNVDLITNFCGAAGGALLGAWFGPALRSGGFLQRLRTQAFMPGAAADLGLVLLALWLFAQLDPATPLFGMGDLRDLFERKVGERHAAQLFVSVEAVTTAANLAAVALLASAGMRPGAPVRGLLAALLALALAVKTLAFSIVMHAEHVYAWLTPGAQLGLVAGVLIALALLWLPRTLRLALGAVLLMAATVLVNLAPPNPYLAATLKVWEQGHFLNFNGLTRLVSTAWPFAALGYLVWIAASRLREPVR